MIWGVPAVATALAVNVPFLYIFVRAFQGGWTSYLKSIWTPATLELLSRTVLLVVGVVTVAVLLAVPLAWLVVRTDLPGRRAWAVLGALPLVFPSYVAALSLVALAGPRGYVQAWLEPLGVERLPALVYGYPGALVALAFFTYPYIYLLVVAELRSLDPALEESSRSLGVTRLQTFFRVVLPQLRPAILGGSLLVSLYTLSDFGAVSIVRFHTFTLSIYNAYRALFDRTQAAALSTLLVVLTLGLVALEARLARRTRPYRARPSAPAGALKLGAWRWPSLLLVASLALVGVGAPVGVVSFWGIRALAQGKALDLAWQASLNSLTVSALAAVVAVGLSVAVVVWAVRYRSPVSWAAERLSYSGHALPGLVIALSLVFFASRHLAVVYQTLLLLVLAYVIRFLPQAATATRASLTAISPSFEEAARSLGRSATNVVGTLTLPMMRRGLLAGGALVFLTSMKELPATLILRPIGFETLASSIWTAASEGIYSEAAVPALLLVAATGLPVYLLIIRPALKGRS